MLIVCVCYGLLCKKAKANIFVFFAYSYLLFPRIKIVATAKLHTL